MGVNIYILLVHCEFESLQQPSFCLGMTSLVLEMRATLDASRGGFHISLFNNYIIRRRRRKYIWRRRSHIPFVHEHINLMRPALNK